MPQSFVHIECRVKFKNTVREDSLPQYIGPGDPVRRGAVVFGPAANNKLLINWRHSSADDAQYCHIQAPINQHSIDILMRKFSEYSSEFSDKMKKLGAQNLNATLKFYQDGEGGNECCDLAKWSLVDYQSALLNNLKSELFRVILPSIIISILCWVFLSGEVGHDKAIFSLIGAASYLASSTLIKPFFEYRKGLSRE